MSFNSDYFLTTKRIGFRAWSIDDLDLAVGLWGDFKVTKLFDGRGPLSKEQVNYRLRQEISNQSDFGFQYWPIFLLESEEHIGCAGLRPHDAPKNILEIGFHICSKYWRKGYASEAARAVMDYAFVSLNAAGLFAGHNPKNLKSRHLLIKLGFNYTHDEFYEPTGLQHPSYLLKKDEYFESLRVNKVGHNKPPEEFALANICLRRHKESDVDAIYEYGSDPQIAKYMDWKLTSNKDSYLESISQRSIKWNNGEEYSWVITLHENQRAIGTISVFPLNGKVEIGFVVHRHHWGKGIATEAAKAIIEWLVHTEGVQAIQATCDAENLASVRVLEKLRFRFIRVDVSGTIRPQLSTLPRDTLVYEYTSPA